MDPHVVRGDLDQRRPVHPVLNLQPHLVHVGRGGGVMVIATISSFGGRAGGGLGGVPTCL